MAVLFDLDKFILQYIVKRKDSLFSHDIQENYDELRRGVQGKRVLVIGGAGSIGSSFIKALLLFKPASLVVVDTNENGLAELSRDLHGTDGLYVPKEYLPYPMDYSGAVFEKMFKSQKGFDVVANFSAHKHVRSEKDIFSVESLLRNNVISAQKLLSIISEYPPEHFFCVSTDKAANPVNIMGASKKIMEDMAFSFSELFPVSTARFANVAFSNGSLPAGFLERISKKQPISAPMDVFRYFVTLQESGEICLLAGLLGNSREIFFPKLEASQMMTFSDIALQLLDVLGFTPMECSSDEEAFQVASDLKSGGKVYPVIFNKSETTGEKGFEEFYTSSETRDLDRFSKMGVITNIKLPDKERLDCLIGSLNKAFLRKFVEKAEIVKLLEDYLPNFSHEERNKYLDSRM